MALELNSDKPLIEIPQDYKGPVTIPDTGRIVYWTGKVAIGLLHKPANNHMQGSQAVWLQKLLAA